MAEGAGECGCGLALLEGVLSLGALGRGRVRVRSERARLTKATRASPLLVRPSVQIQIVLSPTRLAFLALSLAQAQPHSEQRNTDTLSDTPRPPLAQATLPSSQAPRRARTTTTAACAARRAPCHVGPARLELVKEQDVLFPHALPQDRVEEAARARGREGAGSASSSRRASPTERGRGRTCSCRARTWPSSARARSRPPW